MQTTSLFAAITAMADTIEKSAAAVEKRAEGPVPADPGGYTGPSTHPTASAPNNCQVAQEGARSSENEADVKADQGAPSVNNAKDAQPGQQDSVQLNIGTTQSATGEDPSVEDDYKGGTADPGSSHPARTDNTSLDGEKYASLSMVDALNLQTKLANALLADIANGQPLTNQGLKAAAAGGGNLNPSEATTPTNVIKPTMQPSGAAPGGNTSDGIAEMLNKAAAALTPQTNQDMQAGYQLAASMSLTKEAAHQLVTNAISDIINDAVVDADLFSAYYKEEMQKGAADAEAATAGEDHDRSGDDSSGANQSDGGSSGGSSTPSDSGSGSPAGGGGDPSDKGDSSAVLSLLGGGSGGGADPAAGAPPAGGPAGGLGGGPAGGKPSEEELLTQLISALNELGIPVDQLAQLSTTDPAAGGAAMHGEPPAGGGMPPGGGMPTGGGMPPGGPPPGGPPADGGAPPMGDGMKLAAAARQFMQSGRFKYTTANDGTPARKLRNDMKAYLAEALK